VVEGQRGIDLSKRERVARDQGADLRIADRHLPLV
jgi:hypothetical protein